MDKLDFIIESLVADIIREDGPGADESSVRDRLAVAIEDSFYADLVHISTLKLELNGR